MATYTELQAQIQALQIQAQEARKSEIAAVVADIRAKMAEYNLTLSDIGSNGRSARKGFAVAPKYRDPQSGQTWSGRGKMPRWLAAATATGKSKEDFSI